MNRGGAGRGTEGVHVGYYIRSYIAGTLRAGFIALKGNMRPRHTLAGTTALFRV